ncbi:M48 family metallopeptidase [Cupriavidus basilensis]|uniref:M48 family metallopeptidase n=1 Tax=Cupriavidus basilensis TaxID=68895 RepID=UPI0028516EDA|nr:SprT family zinc-dependent metalloprotease [Cupriavidus basilensis]MDR3379945.1 SprT family zinc-dependent metalloprotease [Cupriavidus basilensis]
MSTTGVVYYGNETICFDMVQRPARRTLGIEVHPDGCVLVLVPRGCDEATVREKVCLRANWISRQLAMFARYERHTVPRQYLSGESHRYLGRQYRLRISANNVGVPGNQVKLTRGEMVVTGPDKLPPSQVKELLHRWYLEHARELFARVLDEVFATFANHGFPHPNIVVREMRSRWGSLSPGGQMTLNSRLIQAPRPCIEYVIVHELCHLAHRDHSPGFYALLSQIMPDWQKRKQRLEEALL